MKTQPSFSFDTNTVYQLVQKQDWEGLINIFKNHELCREIFSNSGIQQFIDQHLILALFSDQEKCLAPKYRDYLQDFYALHHSHRHDFILNPESYKKLVVKIVELESAYDVEKALPYAQLFPGEEICLRIIERYEESLPKIVHHSQEHEVQVTESKYIKENDGRIKIFKSRPEYLFYRAARDFFQGFLVLPNVALTAVIDFDLVKEYLTRDERDYFFKALIDCVIIDSEDEYKAIRFIELDSPYHREPQQMVKDEWKNKILGAAGQRLLRVERTVPHESEEAAILSYKRLIREVINNSDSI